jgi:cell wall-associated NlpC family hydrolase
MKRLLPLCGVVLALAFSSSAAADTFRVVHPHSSAGGSSVAFGQTGSVVAFNETQSGGMSFAALQGIWQAAGSRYGIPWEVLAAINKVETDFGRNLGPSSAGAVGWMQFMPSTWARWGIDANGDGVADPDNPTDAIFSAARYLAGCGGQFDIVRAVYCYNHAGWYVKEVLGLASMYSRGETGDSAGLFSAGLTAPRVDLGKARTRVTAAKSELAGARVRARQLAAAERRLLHAAAKASLLTDQLDARKQAVLLGVRRHAADVRVSRLNKRLSAATGQLARLKGEASGASLGSTGLFSASGGDLSFVPAGQYSGVVSIALQYLGVPYVWAGADPETGFDCSGLVQYVYAQIGISLPHNTVAQWNDPDAVSVPPNQLQPGDLVFFNGLDHVGIYIGGRDFIDAPHTGASVRIDSLDAPWFAANFDGAKRIVGASQNGSSGTTLFASGGTSFSSDVVYFTH